MYKVQVLLSSYNGERYIKEQLDSILYQEGVDVSILVRDDGSTDNTLNILSEYSKTHNNFSFVSEENIGVVASFFRLFDLADSSADYFALSDQDDYWDKDKLYMACKELEKDIPSMYCCASRETDEKLTEISSKSQPLRINPCFENAIIENIARGGGIVFNNKLLGYLHVPATKDIYMHDWWVYLVASCFGTVHYSEQPHYSYRQHSDNVLGAASNNLLSKFKRRAKQSKTNKNHISRQMILFNRIYDIPSDKQASLNIITNYRHNLRLRLKGIFGHYFIRQSKLDNLIFKLLFFTNHL